MSRSLLTRFAVYLGASPCTTPAQCDSINWASDWECAPTMRSAIADRDAITSEPCADASHFASHLDSMRAYAARLSGTCYTGCH